MLKHPPSQAISLRSHFPPHFQTLQGLLKLWTHECSRVFEDRLVNNEDREWFQKLISKTMNAEFSVEPKEIVGEGPLLYGDFMMPNTDNKNYEEITDREKVTNCSHINIISYVYLSIFSIKSWINVW